MTDAWTALVMTMAAALIGGAVVWVFMRSQTANAYERGKSELSANLATVMA